MIVVNYINGNILIYFIFLTVVSAQYELPKEHNLQEFDILTQDLSNKHRVDLFNKLSNSTIHLCDYKILPIDDDIGLHWNEKKYAVKMSSFGIFNLSPIVCKDNEIEVSFNKNEYLFLPSGDVYNEFINMTFESDQNSYCLYRELINDNDSWNAKVCLSSPKIPVCCKPGQFYNISSDLCIDSEEESIAPSILVNSNKVQWGEQYYTTILTDIICDSTQDIFIMPINLHNYTGPSGTIEYNDEKSNLIYQTSIDKLPEIKYLDEFCIGSEFNSNGSYFAKMCVSKNIPEDNLPCQEKVCYHKCCPDGEIFDMIRRACFPAPSGSQWAPKFYRSRLNHQKLDIVNVHESNRYLIDGFPLCGDVDALDTEDVFLLQTGELLVKHENEAYLYNTEEYCMDNGIEEDVVPLTLVCFKEPDKTCFISWKGKLMTVLEIISICFLVITFTVYASVKELRVKIHGKILMCYIGSLIVAYTTLAVILISTKYVSMPVCQSLGLVLQFSFLVAFCWQNVMSFDIWRTLRLKRPAGQTARRVMLRFLMYCAYGFGCPTIISSVTVFIYFQENPNLVLPDFGAHDCFLGSFQAKWIYFYSFLVTMMALNCFFYIHVAVILCIATKDSQTILKRTANEEKERVKLYFRLFIVMGIPWICELASSFSAGCKIWLFADVFNALTGVFIFLVFICKRRLLRKLTKSKSLNSQRSSKFFTSLQTTGSFSFSSFRQNHSVVSRNSSGQTSNAIELSQTLSNCTQIIEIKDPNKLRISESIMEEDIDEKTDKDKNEEESTVLIKY